MTPQKIYTLLSLFIFISLLPFLWLFTQTEIAGGLLPAFANISGLLGAAILLWQIIIGNRSIFKIVIPNYPQMLKFHMFLGVYGTFLVLIHPILQIMNYGQNVFYILTPDVSTTFAQNVTYGRIALLLFIIIWITSAIFRKKLKYPNWLSIHHVSYLLIFFVFIHSITIGTYINQFPLLKAYWIFLFVIYAMVLFRKIYLFFRKPSLSHS